MTGLAINMLKPGVPRLYLPDWHYKDQCNHCMNLVLYYLGKTLGIKEKEMKTLWDMS